MKEYSTVSGDTWDMIAFKNYGKERYANELVEANLDHVHKVIFTGNIQLNIPEIDTAETETDLPPWKRGG